MSVKKTVDRNEELNEAASQVKTDMAKAKIPKDESDYAYFVSASPEATAYDLLIAGQMIKGQWDEKKEHLAFRVPKEIAHRFEQHINVLQGRIVRAK
jgi:hypothetical protein